MTRRQFEALVEKAMRRLPKRFKSKIQNIAVVVEDWADDETLADLGIEPPDTLYGLYRGIDLTRRDSSYGNVMPDTITIYQGPIEEDCADEAEMAELVRDTVIHELGHYLRPRRRDHGAYRRFRAVEGSSQRRGTPRLRRGAPNVGGLGGRSELPMQ